MERGLQRREDEDEFEYKVRICIMKLNKEIDLDWCEIVELLGLNCSFDHLRKLAYGYKEYYDYLLKNPKNSDGDKKLKEIREEIAELQIARIQLSDEKRMYKQALREEARRRILLDTILDRIKTLNKEKPMINNVINPVETDKIMCVMLSDLHYGASFNTFLNTYNSEIAKKRVNKYKDEIIKLYDLNSPKEINIELLGDLIENALHITSRLDTDRNVAEQVIEASELLAEFIFQIADYTAVPVNVYLVEGNHDRVTIKREEAMTGESFTGIMREIIKLRLNGVINVNFVDTSYTDDICVMKVFDKHIGLLHGHHEKKQNAKKNLNEFLEGYDYLHEIHCGHWHNVEVTREGVIINGSVKGTDKYSQNLRYNSPPQQIVVIYNQDGSEQINKIILN